MEGTAKSLWLFLLLTLLPLCSSDADQSPSTTQTNAHVEDQGDSSSPAMEPKLTTIDNTYFSDIDNGTRADCLIDTEMGLIAVGSAGGLIVCLLVTIMVLACQICHIQRRVYAPRTSRSNMDLMSNTSYWGTDQQEVRGEVGPCDTSVMLEEVRAGEAREMEEKRQAEIQEARVEAEAGLEEGTVVTAYDAEEKDGQMPSSSSRDSCLEIPRDLENMPLVV